MKLYSAKMLPNPRRIEIFLREKSIALERVYPDLEAGVQKSAEFLRMNPAGKVPVLQLDDGVTCLSESSAILEYLEELYPEPPMLGRTAVERARVRALERIATEVYLRLSLTLQHTHPFFRERRGVHQVPEIAKALEPGLNHGLSLLEGSLSRGDFLADPAPTVVDCSFFATVQTSAVLFDYRIPEHFPALNAWSGRFAERPSAAMGD